MFTSIGRYSSGSRKLCIQSEIKTIKKTFNNIIGANINPVQHRPCSVDDPVDFPNDDSDLDTLLSLGSSIGDDTDADDDDEEEEEENDEEGVIERGHCLTRKRKLVELYVIDNNACGVFDEFTRKDCQRPKYVKSMCRYHYKKWLAKSRCKTPSCSRVAKKEGLCWGHLYKKADQGVCALCSNKVFCKGLCRSHYRRKSEASRGKRS